MVCCNTIPASLTITFLLFLLFFCVGYHFIVLQLEDCFKHVKEEADKQNHRIEILELQTTNLNDQVKFLKSNSENYQNTINNYQMGESKLEGNLLSTNGRQQKAARLIPASLLVNKKDEKMFDAHKPPSSCDDLNELGHTLNGIYLLNGKNKSKIEVAFCDFQSSKSKTSVMGKRVGFIDVKASPGGVYFYCQGASNYKSFAEITIRNDLIPVPPGLRFEVMKLNMGSGMNESTGIFTAPKPGVYHFHFFAQKNSLMPNNAVVHIRCNGHKEATSVTSYGAYKFPVVIHSTLKLKKGDKVDIFHEAGYLDHTLPNTIHFSGFLLEEDVLLK